MTTRPERAPGLAGARGAVLAVLALGLIASLTLYGRARRAAHQAEAARAQAAAEREAARFQAYVANILTANTSLDVDGFGLARSRLDRCADDLRGWEWWHLRLRSDPRIAAGKGHAVNIRAVAFSPDGETIATAAGDGTVRLWSSATAAPLGTLGGPDSDLPQHAVNAVAFSHDGTRLVTGDEGGGLRTWDPATGALSSDVQAHRDPVSSVAFSRDGRFLASGSADRTVRVWDAVDGSPVSVLSDHDNSITAVVFDGSGDLVISGTYAGVVRVWVAASGSLVSRIEAHEHPITSLDFDPATRRLVSGSHDETARLWQMPAARLHATLVHDDVVGAVAFAAAGRHVLTGSWNARLTRWHAEQGTPLGTVAGIAVRDLAVSGDDAYIAVAEGASLAILDGAPSVSQVTLQGPTVEGTGSPPEPGVLPASLTIDPTGSLIAAGTRDSSLALWDVATGTRRAEFSSETSPTTSTTISRDGRRAAATSASRNVLVWDLDSGQLQHVLRDQGEAAVLFSPDGRRLASAFENGAVRVYDLDSGRNLLASEPQEEGPRPSRLRPPLTDRGVAFSPDGRLLATASRRTRFDVTRTRWVTTEATVHVWDIEAGRLALEFEHGPASVLAMTFSRDGRRILTGGDDRNVTVWDAASGERLMTLAGHGGAVTSLAVTPDGTRIVSGSLDRTVRLWHLASGEMLLILAGHAAPVSAVSASPDGRHITSCSIDNVVRTWNASSLYDG